MDGTPGIARPLWERVERERRRQGMSTVELSRRTGLARSTINRLKTNVEPPQATTVRALADALEIDRDEALRLAGLGPMPRRSIAGEDDETAVALDKVTRQWRELRQMIDTWRDTDPDLLDAMYRMGKAADEKRDAS